MAAYAERLRRLARSILKRCSPEELVADDPSLRVVDTWPYGDVYVLEHLWRQVGLPELISELLDNRKFEFSIERALFAMVANRACGPSSKLYCHEQWLAEDVRIEGCEALELHHLYRAMDFLEAHKEALEEGLYFRMADLLNLDVEVVFYDTTSTYFEGQALANPSAKRGYSRDKRPDCKQVVVGLVINRDGFPKAHEIFDGNTQDRASLPAMLDALEARVGGFRRGQTVVVDRGMAFEENLEQLRARGLRYLVASRQQERTRWLAEFETLEGFDEVIREPSPRNPKQKKTKVEVKLKRTEAETFVLCISDGRKQKDRAIRDKHEGRLLRDLDKLHARIGAGRLVDELKIGEAIGRLKERYPRVARYYDIAFDPDAQTLRYSLNEPRRELAERLDGSYVLKSDRTDLGADEAWRIYHLLTRAENAFRCMKSPLAERPIFHQVQRRVETHIFLCVLAYHLLVAIEKTLLDQGVHTSWASVRDALATHAIVTIVLPTDSGATMRIRKASTAESEHRELYRLLGVDENIMSPKTIWSEIADHE